jgi:hypothetical protein
MAKDKRFCCIMSQATCDSFVDNISSPQEELAGNIISCFALMGIIIINDPGLTETQALSWVNLNLLLNLVFTVEMIVDIYVVYTQKVT